MRTRCYMACLAGSIGLILLLGSACTKSIQANSGSKSFEPGKKKETTTAAARAGGSGSGTPSLGGGKHPGSGQGLSGEELGGSGLGSLRGGESGVGGKASEGRRFGSTDFDGKDVEAGQGESLSPSPSFPPLSGIEGSRAPITGQASSEQRMPTDMVAKTEPSDSARRQVEEMQRDQVATAAAGLEDVFFGFDTWQLTNEGKQALILDAEWLKANPEKVILIEGHCDERGTLAYNLVLGEKRAKTVQNFLAELGVPANRLKIVSYGKERPFCKEHDENCYQLNRRGHLVVRFQ
jgi:peptidoglycan-associated lipoprotein